MNGMNGLDANGMNSAQWCAPTSSAVPFRWPHASTVAPSLISTKHSLTLYLNDLMNNVWLRLMYVWMNLSESVCLMWSSDQCVVPHFFAARCELCFLLTLWVGAFFLGDTLTTYGEPSSWFSWCSIPRMKLSPSSSRASAAISFLSSSTALL